MHTILICDDDRDIVSALDIYLTSEGYKTMKAYNGKEALQVVENHEIHLILMDIMMPELDGIRTTAKLREGSNVPIILLTAKSEDLDKVQGLEAGADAYLTADIKFHEAQKAVETGICVADVTHYASEVLIVPVIQKALEQAAAEKGWALEVVCSKVNGQTFWAL